MVQASSDSAVPFHRLKSLSVVGGFLDGVIMEFPSGLSCVIGPRGTGKTTAIELIRYALEEFRGDVNREIYRRVESLVQANLGGGRISLAVETGDGIEYQVHRSAGEEPIVFSGDDVPTNISLGGTGLFGADIYSQDQVETIADNPLSQLALLDGFIAAPVAEVEEQIQSTIHQLKSSGLVIVKLRNERATLSDTLTELPAIEQKLKQFAATGGTSSDAVNRAHQEKALRDREAMSVDRTVALLRKEYATLSKIPGQIAAQTPDFEIDMLTGANRELLQVVNTLVADCGKKVDAAVESARIALETAGRAVADIQTKLRTEHQRQEVNFRQLIEKNKEAEAQSAERAKLDRKRNELLANQRKVAEVGTRLAEAQRERGVLLAQLSELRDQRYRLRKENADRISAQLGRMIRVRIEQFGNFDAYRRLLEEALKGGNINRIVVAAKIAAALSPAELSVVVSERRSEYLVEQAGINANQAQFVVATLDSPELLCELETVELIDLPHIELLDGEQYKDSLSLSTGQKCTTILPILLLDSPKPLIIDQPENNLDNSFIYGTVVKAISEMKSRRQMIFVTHNPNIPVLGDAERVFVLRSDGSCASVRSGSIDECKDDIITLLEGGAEAFRQRQRRYDTDAA